MTGGVFRMLAALLDALPDPLAEIELRRQLCRETYAAGLAEGWRLGVEHGARIRQADWPEVVKPLTAPTVAELELLRWGPGGRGHFGDRRPGDYTPQTRLGAAS